MICWSLHFSLGWCRAVVTGRQTPESRNDLSRSSCRRHCNHLIAAVLDRERYKEQGIRNFILLALIIRNFSYLARSKSADCDVVGIFILSRQRIVVMVSSGASDVIVGMWVKKQGGHVLFGMW